MSLLGLAGQQEASSGHYSAAGLAWQWHGRMALEKKWRSTGKESQTRRRRPPGTWTLDGAFEGFSPACSRGARHVPSAPILGP